MQLCPNSAGVAELRHFQSSGFFVKPVTRQKTQKLKTSIKLITVEISVPINRKTCNQPRIFKRFENQSQSFSLWERVYHLLKPPFVESTNKSLRIFKIHQGKHTVSAVCLTGITLGSKAGKSLTHGFEPKPFSGQAEVPRARHLSCALQGCVLQSCRS